ncbi:bis(5'-nucleosyl)-tetraphosphatase (symmetrical) YqeK [Tepidanaerobacter acetatoxydans]|uniref:bis(5'-nucleosyl)-tetraphosphatase (symmetrical) YqeK n=1 Tax=Tepidanaerobacter acetatoxydans TaxID=499229 RepID=UPI001BD2F0F2
MTLEEMKRKLRKSMNDKRFLHSLGVMQTAEKLAGRYGEDIEKAKVAGLLHDCAKGLDMECQLKLAKYFGILLDDIERREKVLIHGPLGAAIAKVEYGINDEQILTAIKVHTTGDADMSLLDRIIFLSDFIEPNRCFPGVEELRVKAFQDLDDAIIGAFDSTIRYVLSKKSLLHPRTILGRNFILMQRESEGRV